MRKPTLLLVALVMASVVIPFTPVEGASVWDIVVRYEIDDSTGNVTDHSLTGTYSNTINCTSGWEHEGTLLESTPDTSHVIEYSVSFLDGEIQRMEQDDGDVATDLYSCADFGLPLALLGDGWIESESTVGDSDCYIEKTSWSYIAPAVTSEGRPFAIENEADGVCLTVRAARIDNTGGIPFTGEVKGYLEDDTGDTTYPASTGDVLYGVRWGGGYSVHQPFSWDDFNCPIGEQFCSWTAHVWTESFEDLGGSALGTWGATVETSR